MKKSVLRFSIYSGITLVITGTLNYLIAAGAKLSFSQQEIGGYASILLSMIFVFLGVKQYRDKENGGEITYLKALKVGFLITLLPSIAFGIFDIIYVKFLDPGFMEKYYNSTLGQMKASLPPAEFQAKSIQMADEMKMFSNPIAQFLIMALTVLAIGTVIAAISALILQRKPKLKTA
ncbi:MAG: DUF4199 domain-containing protein [Bacteroidia bacterium]